MFQKVKRLYHTIKHVRFEQIYFQVYYRLKKYFNLKPKNVKTPLSASLKWKGSIAYSNRYLGNRTFQFLNLEKSFEVIDWNFPRFGKLWTYNLTYFDFLNQKDVSKAEGLELICDFIENEADLKDGLEPYPISLRGINWIKFLTQNNVQDPEVDSCLYRHYQRLMVNIEYHILANHLLENGFSLLFGAYYFKDDKLYKKAKSILLNELKEQFLSDGGHYELSPMYHQILLHRILDAYQLVAHNNWKNHELSNELKEKAGKALGWLKVFSLAKDQIPFLNDSAPSIAPTTINLCDYALKLGIEPLKTELTDSGYRKFEMGKLEMIMDIGQIAPSYQPGHSHADSLQFVLNYDTFPVIVDMGISTYEKNERRLLERSTSSHNTITVNGINSSKVWSGFRVAQRAKVILHKEDIDILEASHDGYAQLGAIHRRRFEKLEDCFAIADEVKQKLGRKTLNEGHLHFHPDLTLRIEGNILWVGDFLKFDFFNTKSIHIEDYKLAMGYNTLVDSKKAIYVFDQSAYFTISPMLNTNTSDENNIPHR